MKLQTVARSAAAAAVALLIAGCGGGGGSTDLGVTSPTTASSLQVSGTAATGAALADASVSVKCATGTGTATTTSAGGYTVTVEGGALPCLVKVSGLTATGVEITLHSVTEAGTSTDGTTRAVANVTPITEMIVAQLTAALPATSFESFDLAQINTTTVTQAATAVVNALQALGVDLTNIDPLKAELVPITATNTDGNAYDDALEVLGQTVTPEALPVLVTQLAAAAATGSTDSASTVVAAAAGGTLEGCPSALSGKYRVIDYFGATQVVQIDFSKMKAIGDGSEITITKNATQACEVSLEDGNGTVVAFSSGGIGALRDNYTTGFLFPAQALAQADLVGDWMLVESGREDTGGLTNFIGKFMVKADLTSTVCDYNVETGINGTCTLDEGSGTFSAGTDGGVVLNMGDYPAHIYGYRAPSGALTLFGTNNPTGATGAVMQTHFVAFKAPLAAVSLPTLNEVRKSWSLVMRQPSGGSLTSVMSREQATITAVDAANGTFSRVFDSAPTTTDIFSVNKPITGMMHRANRANIYAVPVPGTGVSLAVTAPGNTTFLYSTSVARP